MKTMDFKRALGQGIVVFLGFKLAETISDRFRDTTNTVKEKMYNKTIAFVNRLYGKEEEVKDETESDAAV